MSSSNVIKNLVPVTELGSGFYSLPAGNGLNTMHAYHKFCPWHPEKPELLFLSYHNSAQPGNICSLNIETGDCITLGNTSAYDWHNSAFQMWQPDGKAIFLHSVDSDHKDMRIYQVSDLQGGSEKIEIPFLVESTNRAGWLIGNRDGCGGRYNRQQTGVMGMEIATGKVSILCSASRALDCNPDKDDIADLNLFCKQVMVHPKLPLVLFSLTNGLTEGIDKRRAYLYILNFVTDELSFVGEFGHHPAWHPDEPWITCFADDSEGRRRVAMYKFNPADKSCEIKYLKHFSTSGHPTAAPGGGYVLFDDYDYKPGYVTLFLYDMFEERSIKLAECERMKKYPEAAADANKTFAELNYGNRPMFYSQAHPAWNRTGDCIAFNADFSGKVQCYIINLNELGKILEK